MPEAIAVNGVRKRYGDLTAVDGVSFAVEEGEIFGILGPNGAGKTTILEIVEGLRQADEGSVSVFGERPWPRNQGLLPRIGVQLQTSAFFERLTAREQLRVFVRLYGAADRRIDETLELVGLTDRAGARVEKLSGGQVQRLAIACAVAHDPDLVFLDEPTAALDPQARRNLWDLIRSIREAGKTVVMTTHYLDEAETLCDRVAIMDRGRILSLDAPASLARELDAPVRIVLPRDQLGADAARELPGASDVHEDGVSVVIRTRDTASVLTALADRGLLDELEVHGASLEDVFLALTGREYRE